MRRYLLPEAGTFYKANLHCHTIFSDGALTPAQVKDCYRKLGYSIGAYPDHNIMVAHDELTVRTAEYDGRLRNYFSITTAGLRRIEEFKTEWQEAISIYRFVTKEESHG